MECFLENESSGLWVCNGCRGFDSLLMFVMFACLGCTKVEANCNSPVPAIEGHDFDVFCSDLLSTELESVQDVQGQTCQFTLTSNTQWNVGVAPLALGWKNCQKCERQLKCKQSPCTTLAKSMHEIK